MNRADWARMPGARKSRYGTDPVGMARIRVNVSPKMTSHRAGWMARVTSSVRSWRSFCNSTRHIAYTRVPSRRSAFVLTDAAGGAASCPDIAKPPSIQRVAGVPAEDRVQVVARAIVDRGGQPADELGRRTERADGAPVHQGDPVAVLLGFLHVVRGDQYRHAGPLAQCGD